MSLQTALKFDLHRSSSTTHLPLQILPQSDPPSVDFSVGDIRRQIMAEWLDIVHSQR